MREEPKAPSQQPSVWSNVGKFVVLLLLLLLVLSFFAPAGGDCIGRIKITGDIAYDASVSALGAPSVNTPEEINQLLQEADKAEKVKAILIQVNSGGGSSVASKEIFDKIAKLEKPTLAYITEIGASGGYYVIAGTDYIIAHPNAITGSIGARATLLNYEGLFEKLGLREETIKSGELKDIGTGARNLTEKERKLLNELIAETFGIFRKDVEEGRKGKLNGYLFKDALDARILSASKAKEIGLIDEAAGMERVLQKANELAGNKAEKQLEVCDYSPKRGFDFFSGLSSEFGKGFAKGFVEGLQKENAKVEYR